MLIDTHCHLTSAEIEPQIGDVLARARAAGVERLVTVATDINDVLAASRLMRDQPAISLAAGIHPHEAGKVTPEDLARLSALHRGESDFGLASERLVAVGETGLDFHYDFATPQRQEEVFRYQLELACAASRPVVIHARKSESQVCDVLGDYPQLRGRVVFHCFSGDVAVARRILDMGLWLSFTGVVTFRNAGALLDVVRFVPGDRLMVETDAPFLSPEPVRKIRPNEPAFVAHTARFLADTRGEAFDEFAALTTANAVRFFHLPEDGQ